MSIRRPVGLRVIPVVFAMALAVSLGLVAPSAGLPTAAASTTTTTTIASGAKVSLTAPTATVTGNRVDFSHSVSVSKRTTFRFLQVAVRPAVGDLNKDTGRQSYLTFSGRRDFTARQTLDPGAWRAFVAFSTDGTSWTQGPVTSFTVKGLTTATTSSPVPSAGGVSQIGYFYRPPVGVSLDSVAASHDRYILTRLDEPTRDALRQRGETKPILQYLRFEAIMDNTGLGYSWQNQVAFKQSDWADISRNHPDWFLLDANGRRMKAGAGDASETSFYLMDPANPGWRSFFVTRMREMQTEGRWDGVFLDNVELSLAKRQRTGQVPAKYPTDASYQKAVQEFLAFLNASYFVPERKIVEANLIEQRTGNDPLWHQNLAHMQGAMREGWAIGWDDSRLLDVWSWEKELEQAEQSQRAGKHVWLVAIGTKDNHKRQNFAYASYLLVASGNASFRYASASAYDQPWLYANYARDLGAPLGPRYKVGSAWKRDFAKGTVSVDPASGAATIS